MNAKLELNPTNDGNAELLVYGEIGDPYDGITGRQVAELVATVAKDAEVINVRINSRGGSASEGVAIHNVLLQHPARIEVDVDSIAASAASVIAMAGDTIRMGPATLMMIHGPRAGLQGYYTGAELLEAAEYLDKTANSVAEIYAGRSGKPLGEIIQLLESTSWFDGQEAIEAGFATEVTDRPPVAASLDCPLLGEVPADKRERFEAATMKQPSDPMPSRSATLEIDQRLRLARGRSRSTV
ncbi:MAG: head maturation protease, ClpP-related [Planctomycetota bacterium]